MKTKLLPFLTVAVFSYKCSISQQANKGGLKSLTWIEGNWRGMDGNKAFYEIYHIKDDSTLVITSYEWDGKDSSKTSISSVRRKDGSYYLGDNFNWKVTAISEGSIFMEPVFKASNTILWKKRDQNTWEAILESKGGRKVYVMQRVNHFPGK
jgi:hypothetical protein